MSSSKTFNRCLVLLLALGVVAVSAFQVPSVKLSAKRIIQSRIYASNSNELFPMKRGSTVALVTPFDETTGKVNYQDLQSLLQRQIKAGTKNLCILGTTGEANVLSSEERTNILKMAVEECKGKMTILAGTGTIDPVHVKEMTLEAKDLGCDAALIVTPYYVKPPQRALVKHFLTAASYGLPVVIYNVPGRTKVDMSDASIAICAREHEGIVAVKDATGDVNRLVSLKQALREANVPDDRSFLCYSGDDGSTTDYLLKGGDGCISVTANVAPMQMAEMVEAALAGNAALANKLNEPMQALHSNLFCESNPIPTKWALQRMGLISSAHCRPPLDAMDPAFAGLVETALRAAGML